MPRPRLETPVFRLVRRAGRRSWYLRWTEAGRSQEISTGERARAEAEAFAARYLREQREPARDLAGTIDAHVATKRHRASYPWLVKHARQLKAHLAALGATDLEHVTPALVADYIARRGDKVTSCRHELELLRSATGAKVSLPAKRPPRERAIGRVDGRRLLEGARGHVRLFVLIAMTTGRRGNAILDLTWDRVDFRRGVIDFRNPAKGESNKRRGVSPMGPMLRGALAHAKKWAETDHVIERNKRPVKDIRRGFWWAMKRAGLGTGVGRAFKPAFSPHALKHSAISWLAEDGVTVDEIADLTDTDPKTVRRIYRRINPGALRGLAERLESAVAPKIRTVSVETRRKPPSFAIRSRRSG